MKPTIVHDNRAQEREFINKRAFKKINSLEKIITFYEKNGLRDTNDTKIKTEKKKKQKSAFLFTCNLCGSKNPPQVAQAACLKRKCSPARPIDGA